jgi:hypothetical protein
MTTMTAQSETYDRLRRFIMTNPAQLKPTSRKDTDNRNTWIEKRGDDVAVRLHNTDIVRISPDGTIILNSGGWRTTTTKDRINYHMMDHFYIYQEKSVWYVISKQTEQKVVYQDHMVILPGGTFAGHGDQQEADRINQLSAKINIYARAFARKMAAGEIVKPTGGDCWKCLMVTQDRTSWGDAGKDTGHLLMHLEEEYYVPSLLVNAVKENDVGLLVKDFIGRMWHGTNEQRQEALKGGWLSDVVENQVSSSIRRYMRKRLDITN